MFLPADERQATRIGRFLMAAGTSLLVCITLVFCAAMGLLPWRAAGRRVSITIGVAQLAPGEAVSAALARADRALYEGKAAGRNRVVVG